MTNSEIASWVSQNNPSPKTPTIPKHGFRDESSSHTSTTILGCLALLEVLGLLSKNGKNQRKR